MFQLPNMAVSIGKASHVLSQGRDFTGHMSACVLLVRGLKKTEQSPRDCVWYKDTHAHLARRILSTAIRARSEKRVLDPCQGDAGRHVRRHPYCPT